MDLEKKTYGIQLDPEQNKELEKLAAMNYTAKEMAMYFDMPADQFKKAYESKDSVIYYHIKRGKLLYKAQEGMALLSDASAGSVTASQHLMKINNLLNYNKSRKNYIYDDDNKYAKIAAYIENGCTKELSDDEELYIEILTMMNSMRRKYGKKKSIIFFTKDPFNFSRHRARSLFEKSIQFFYSDQKIEKKALRNLRAEMIIEAADVVLANAKTSKDYEVYSNMITQASKLQQLDQPDPPDIPKGLYDKPVKLYVLDPEKLGMQSADRNELARHIDSLEVPESVKRRARQDSNIIDINFEEIINDVEKENKGDK